MSVLKFDEELERRVRGEDWSGLQVSTYSRICDAVEAVEAKSAMELTEYFMDEALICKRLFDQWVSDTQKYLLLKGYGEGRLIHLNQKINRVINQDQNGEYWDRDKGWQEFVFNKELLVEQIANSDPTDSLRESLLKMKEAWRVSHDLDVDYLLGLYDAVLNEYGEEAIGEMYEEYTIKSWFEERYSRFDVSKYEWDSIFPLLVFLSFEAMHGHLCGAGREGDVEYEEFSDRIELQFDPCGSGGRAYRGEPIEETGSRMEAPYHYKAIEGAHDFTWNKKGVCTYCAHCCILTEKMSAEKFGYPVRIIEPPTYPGNKSAKCKYIIYKNLHEIPEHYYRRIGLQKPSRTRGLGSENGPYGRRVDPAE